MLVSFCHPFSVMARTCCVRMFRTGNSRRMYMVSSNFCNNQPATSKEKKSYNAMDALQGGTNHKVDNLEKRFLVWSGKYKSIDDVPPTVSQQTMEKARNKARIRIANYMMLATIIACIGFVYSGKQAAKRGETVQKMNLDWHKEVNEGK